MNQNQPGTVTRVLIVDDHPAICEALTIQVSRQPDIEVCGTAGNVIDALRLVETANPDVAVVDISLKNDCGIDLISRIRDRNPGVRTIVWSTYSENYYADRALKAGALAFINKDQATDKIVDAIRHVKHGKYYLSDAMSQRIMNEIATNGKKSPFQSVSKLSNRELQVFRLIGQGRNSKDVAETMHLCQTTVETYRNRIRQKLELKDASELAYFATRWVMENQSG